jgi:hypothetical protein
MNQEIEFIKSTVFKCPRLLAGHIFKRSNYYVTITHGAFSELVSYYWLLICSGMFSEFFSRLQQDIFRRAPQSEKVNYGRIRFGEILRDAIRQNPWNLDVVNKSAYFMPCPTKKEMFEKWPKILVVEAEIKRDPRVEKATDAQIEQLNKLMVKYNCWDAANPSNHVPGNPLTIIDTEPRGVKLSYPGQPWINPHTKKTLILIATCYLAWRYRAALKKMATGLFHR